MNFGVKSYFKPTPKRIRIFGDSLAAAGTFGASIVILNGEPTARRTAHRGQCNGLGIRGQRQLVHDHERNNRWLGELC